MIAAFVFAAAYAAFVVSAVAGGGAGLALVPLLGALVAIESVPAALSVGTATSALSRIAVFRAAIRWDIVRRFVPTALPATALGAWLLTRFEPVYVELLLSGFLLAQLPALFRRPVATASLSPSRRGGLTLPAVGATAGLLSGFTGAVGLLFNGFYLSLGLTKEEIVATRAANEVLLHLLKLALYGAFGLLTGPALLAGAMVAAAAALASVSARWLLPLIQESTFRRINVAAMVLAGLAMLAMSGVQIARMHGAGVEMARAGDEFAVELRWGGARAFAAEWEAGRFPAIERTVPFDSLAGDARAAVEAVSPRVDLIAVEQVLSPGATAYEVVFLRDGRPAHATVVP